MEWAVGTEAVEKVVGWRRWRGGGAGGGDECGGEGGADGAETEVEARVVEAMGECDGAEEVRWRRRRRRRGGSGGGEGEAGTVAEGGATVVGDLAGARAGEATVAATAVGGWWW